MPLNMLRSYYFNS